MKRCERAESRWCIKMRSDGEIMRIEGEWRRVGGITGTGFMVTIT